MKSVFNPIDLGGIAVRNRTVRSATYENPGWDLSGAGGDALAEIYGELARGGVGVIISGMFGVDPMGLANPNMVRTYADGFEDGLAKVAKAVHDGGGALVVQLCHCGAKALPQQEGTMAMGPSALEFAPGRQAREMTEADIAQVVQRFAQAAARCQAGGADGVQLHGAHGYLLSQFLSPSFNRRTDAYGGGIAGRARFLLEAYDAMREAVGPYYPIWLKINSDDLVEPSITLEECTAVCQMLDDRGINAIEVSGGLGMGRESSPSFVVTGPEEEGSFLKQGLEVADKVTTDVISVGGYRSIEQMEVALNTGDIAALSLCRPLISEPELVARWKTGDTAPARCTSCNRCFSPKGGFGCKAFQKEH